MTYRHIMAGVLEQLRRSRRQLVGCNASMPEVNPNVLQLQAAKEILAEVFGIRTSEVDEMLRQRHEENTEWPQEFYLD
jgi:hypothetical protein